MAIELVWALNTINGVVGQIPKHVFEHPTFARHHVEVAPFTESFNAEDWKATTADEYIAAKDREARAAISAPVVKVTSENDSK